MKFVSKAEIHRPYAGPYTKDKPVGSIEVIAPGTEFDATKEWGEENVSAIYSNKQEAAEALKMQTAVGSVASDQGRPGFSYRLPKGARKAPSSEPGTDANLSAEQTAKEAGENGGDDKSGKSGKGKPTPADLT